MRHCRWGWAENPAPWVSWAPHHSRGSDHPGCFSGRAQTQLLSKPRPGLGRGLLTGARPPGSLLQTEGSLFPGLSQLPTARRMKCLPRPDDSPVLPGLPTPLQCVARLPPPCELLITFQKNAQTLLRKAFPITTPPSLSQWFSIRGNVAPRVHLARFRAIFGCHTGRVLLASCGHRPGVLLDTLSCRTQDRSRPHNPRALSGPKSPVLRKPCSMGQAPPPVPSLLPPACPHSRYCPEKAAARYCALPPDYISTWGRSGSSVPEAQRRPGVEEPSLITRL